MADLSVPLNDHYLHGQLSNNDSNHDDEHDSNSKPHRESQTEYNPHGPNLNHSDSSNSFTSNSSISSPVNNLHSSNHSHHSHHKEEIPWYLEGLFPPPKLLVDWGKHNPDRKVSWSELFFDLVFATSIAKLTEGLYSDELTVGEFVILFISVFQQWQSWLIYCTRFYSDDLGGKIYTGLYMLGVFGLNIHILEAHNTNEFLFSWIYLRFVTLILFARIYYYIERARRLCMSQIVAQVLIILVQVVAIFSPHNSRLYAFFCIAMIQPISLYLLVCLTNNVRNTVPIDVHHFIERTGCFVLIVIGEALNDLVGTDKSDIENYRTEYYVTGILGFTLVFALKMLYFDIDVIPMRNHALRRNRLTGVSWIVIHAILVCSIGFICVGIRMFVQLVGGLSQEESTAESHSLVLISKFYEESSTSTGSHNDTSSEHNYTEELLAEEHHRTKNARMFLLLGTLIYLGILMIVRCLHSHILVDPSISCMNCRLFESVSNSALLSRVWLFQMISQLIIALICLILYFNSDGLSNLGLLIFVSSLGVFLVGINFIDELLGRRMAQKHFDPLTHENNNNNNNNNNSEQTH